MERGLGRDGFHQEPRAVLGGEIPRRFFDAVLDQARAANLLSDDHFTVDGMLVEASASHKSFKRAPEDRQGILSELL
jgi:hypothetical protein